MGWIFLAELGESQKPSSNGLEQSPIAKSTHIVKESSSLEWNLEILTKPQSVPTSKVYNFHLRSTIVSISYSGDFLAKGLVLQDLEKAWQMSEADYFMRSSGSVAKLSPDLSSWKTCQPSLLEEEQKWSGKLPRWGMTVDGALYPLRPLEHYIVERDGSYWLTPSTMEHLPVREGEALENALHRGKNRDSRRKVSGRLNEQVAYPQMWPTPSARDWKDSGDEPAAQARKSPCLPAAVKIRMATPTASQATKPILAPVPSVVAGKHGETTQQSVGRLNPESIGKRLCPRWVSVLMGFPTTWTDCEPWVIAWFQSKSKKRSKS